MRGKPVIGRWGRSGAFVLSAFALLSLAACDTGAPKPLAMVAASATDPEAVHRGQYLFDAANCVGCHTDTKNHGARLAGGRAIETPFGAYYSRNITPDPTTGIGAWSDADFLRALRRGISPDGAHYFPAFPFPSFTGMTDRDILDIKAYLFTEQPVVQANKPHAVPFPFDVRSTMVGWRLFYFTPGPLAPDPSKSAEWNRGAYLANAVAHCGDCHTPRDWLGALENDRRFAGAKLAGPGNIRAKNISSHLTDGIGKWKVEDIAEVLRSGATPDGDFVEKPMSEVVEATAKLTPADRLAIATYVKSIPPQAGKP
jgi:mono/diheme cytochrome c family protein